MKKIFVFGLGLMMMSLLLAGCGGGGGNAPAPIRPSATDFPFGVSSIIHSMNEEILSVNFAYDAAGRVVEVHVTAERESSQDGRIDQMYTVVYTLDPEIVVIEVPDMMEMFRELGAIDGVVLQAGPPVFEKIPYFINDLPGAVVEVAFHLYSYEPHRISAVQVPEEMVLIGSVLFTFDYDATGRLFRMALEEESPLGSASIVRTGTFDAAGRLTRIMTLFRVDADSNGWIDENHAIEITYTYNAAGYLIKRVVDDYDDSDLVITTLVYDEDGRLTEAMTQIVDKQDEQPTFEEIIRNTYDENGNLIEEVLTEANIDPAGDRFPIYNHVTRYGYDERGRILEKIRQNYSVEAPLIVSESHIFSYVYGDSGLTDYTYDFEDSGGRSSVDAYRYTYNEQGQLTQKRHRDFYADQFYVDTFGYDTEGRLVSKQEATHFVVDDEPGPDWDGTIITFNYDEKGRLAGWVYEDFEVRKIVVELSYDANEHYATADIRDFDWDPAAADGAGDYVPAGTPRSITVSFLSGAPRGTMALGIAPPEHMEPKDFEIVRIYVEEPALYGFMNLTSNMRWFIVR